VPADCDPFISFCWISKTSRPINELQLLHVHLSSRGLFDVTSLPPFDWPNNAKTYTKDV